MAVNGRPPSHVLSRRYTLNRESNHSRGLIAWYPLDEAGVERVFDRARGNTAVCPDAVTSTITSDVTGMGRVKTSLGTSAYDTFDAPALDYMNSARSWSAWIKLGDDAAYRSIITKGYSQSWHFGVFQSGAGSFLQLWVAANNHNSTFTLTSPSSELVHVAATWDQANIRMFVNGVLLDTIAQAGAAINGSAVVKIGAGSDTTNTAYMFKGQLHDIRVHDSVLTPAEAWSLYDPRTRWDLYRPIGRSRAYSIPAGGTVYTRSGSGGATASGSASRLLVLSRSGSGTATGGGAATSAGTLTRAGYGGATGAGASDRQLTLTRAGDGTATGGGSAGVVTEGTTVVAGSGGAVGGGAASRQITLSRSGDGTATGGGSAVAVHVYSAIAAGGAVLAGAATRVLELVRAGAGGILAAGAALRGLVLSRTGSGTATGGGAAGVDTTQESGPAPNSRVGKIGGARVGRIGGSRASLRPRR